MTYLRGAWRFVREVVDAVVDDRCVTAAGAVAFYTLFSLPPLLAILVNIAGAVAGQARVEAAVIAQARHLMGPETAEQLRTTSAIVADVGGFDTLTAVLTSVALAVSATAVFAQLHQGLQDAWNVPQADRRRGFVPMVVRRALALLLIGVVGLLLVAILAVQAFVSMWATELAALLGPMAAAVFRVGEMALVWVTLTGLVSSMYRVLPEVPVARRDVARAGAITSTAVMVGRVGLGWYFSFAEVGSAYGAAGSLAVILMWVYYIAIVFFVSAEITQAWARHEGRRLGASRS